MLAELCTSPTICLGIPTYLRESVLLDTLEDVFAQTDPPDEIVVADQTLEHQPRAADRLAHWHASGKIRWIKLADASLTAARNAILRASNCEYVLYVDDDVRLRPDYVASVRSSLSNSRATALAGKVVLLGADEHSCGSYRPLRFLPQLLELYRGSNQAVHRETALKVGGFDERFVGPAHGEEQDFAFRLLKAGHSVAFDPSLQVVHLHASTGGCRVADNPAWDDWQKPMSLLMLSFRYPRPLHAWWWGRLWSALRCGPLLKENISLRRQARAWTAFRYALKEAWQRRHYAGPY